MSTDAHSHYSAGRLTEALAAATAAVRSRPADTAARLFLVELLCFAGDLERADRQLDIVNDQDSSLTMGISLFRQLIRGEQARQQFFAEGRLPEFVGEPPARLQPALQASIALREGDTAEAARLTAAAEAERTPLAGTCDGTPFNDFRDLDDVTAGVFETITSTGKYFWIPIETVATIELHAPKRPRDLIWQRATMSVRGGPEGEVFLPCRYAGSVRADNEMVRLGRATDWNGGEGAPVLGAGLRTFLVGDADKTVLEISDIRFGTD